MKLSEWACSKGISYLTAYRWFKAGKLPEGVSAIQASSGTIIVQDSSMENKMTEDNITTKFLEKMYEYSQANLSINDFAAYVLNNFQLKPNATIQEDYENALSKISSTVKNKTEIDSKSYEMFNNHYKKFLKPLEAKPEISMSYVNVNEIKMPDEVDFSPPKDFDISVLQTNNFTDKKPQPNLYCFSDSELKIDESLGLSRSIDIENNNLNSFVTYSSFSTSNTTTPAVNSFSGYIPKEQIINNNLSMNQETRLDKDLKKKIKKKKDKKNK